MEDDWEQIADNNTIVIPPVKKNVNKWDGEDEDDDVKESWEDEIDEKKDEEKSEVKMVKAKPKKSLAEKIAEKEKLKLEEDQRKQELEDEERTRLSPEEKLRLQKLQEEADLQTALDTLGITSTPSGGGIDAMNPTTKSEFAEFADAISKKISQYKHSEEYTGFLEDLIRSVCANLSSIDIRRIKTTLDNLHLEKQKMEKEKNKKGKSKSKAGIRVERDNQTASMDADYGYGDGEYDDFM